MQRLDQVVMQWDAETRVTLTVRVERGGRPGGGPERRLEELIAGAIWLAVQGIDEPATRPE